MESGHHIVVRIRVCVKSVCMICTVKQDMIVIITNVYGLDTNVILILNALKIGCAMICAENVYWDVETMTIAQVKHHIVVRQRANARNVGPTSIVNSGKNVMKAIFVLRDPEVKNALKGTKNMATDADTVSGYEWNAATQKIV